MDVGRRAGVISGVVAGSVWESRMKIDEVRGGIKVFNGEEGSEESEAASSTRLKKVLTAGVVASGKRKTWKSESSEGLERNPIQIAKGKTDLQNNSDEKCKELSVSSEGIKKNAIQVRESRSEANKEIISAISKIKRSPIQTRKSKIEFVNGSGESSEKIEKNSVQNRKLKPDSVKMKKMNKSGDSIDKFGEKICENSNAKSEKSSEESVDQIEKLQSAISGNGGEETCREFGVCEEKIISNTRSYEEEEEAEEDDDYESENRGDEEEELKIEKKKIDIKEIDKPVSKQITNGVSKFHRAYEKSIPTSFTVKQSPPIQNLSKPFPRSDEYNNSQQNHDKLQSPDSDEHNIFPENHSKLQSLVDLVMWRDVSRSAFVFGIGTFAIISSSYTKDITISFISVISYLGLVYLAAIFLYRSMICRGVTDIHDGERYVVGEEEAIWVVKLFLPYMNELLLKIRALFCGDPATTIKLAGLLFVLARCGSSITIWKVVKWGFFGVFTVPKVSASYSSQLTLFVKFWITRFRDVWDSCSHKKGVAITVFILVWNLSSVVVRIWAAFMLYVALRCYQQSVMSDDKDRFEDTCQDPVVRQRLDSSPTLGGSASRKTKRNC